MRSMLVSWFINIVKYVCIIMYTSIGSILSVQSKMAQPVKGEPVYLRERLQSREEHVPGQEASFLSLSLKGEVSLISDLNF